MSIDAAKKLACEAHAGQTRKYNGNPYISHPMRVAHLVTHTTMTWFEEDHQSTIEAAWLHDVLEDCPKITEQMILDATSASTLRIVKELTNPSKGSKLSRPKRKHWDREHLKTASRNAKIIKLIDRYDNLSELLLDMQHNADARKFARLYAKESKKLLYAIHDAHDKWSISLLVAIGKVYTAASSDCSVT